MDDALRPHPRHRILLVDDDEAILQVLSDLFTREGEEVIATTNPLTALETFENNPPNLAFLDVKMPEMDGMELCRIIKANPDWSDIPVIFITGIVDSAEVEKGIAAGASDYIKKPFDRDEVRIRARIQLQLQEMADKQRNIQKRLEIISQAAMDAIIMMDNNGKIAHWNEAAESMFGYSREEALGKDLHLLLAPVRFIENHRQAFSSFQNADISRAAGKTQELVGLRKTGEEFPLELSLAAAKVEGLWWAVGIVRDVTERKAIEQRLRENENRLRTILESMPVGIALVGLDQRIRWVNPAALEMLKFSSLEEISGVPCNEILCQNQGCACQVLDNHIEVEKAEKMLRRRDGSYLPVLKTVLKVQFENETVLLEAFIDVSKWKQLEAELYLARKLEAVGQLAAGIAHEINTPTQYVGDSVYFLKETFSDFGRLIAEYQRALSALKETGRKEVLVKEVSELEESVDLEYLLSNIPSAFDRCEDGITRISRIVSAMKEFAHPDQREKSPADINRALESTLIIARNEYKYVADIETDFEEIPSVVCHIGDLNQVFLNLIVNSAHAISDIAKSSGVKGKIHVSTRRSDDSVLISISDTGAGIPASIHERVFEPFFTTKPVGKGSGQGLAIARSIVVDKHGGSLTFDSKVGQGTTFTIRLPLTGKPADK